MSLPPSPEAFRKGSKGITRGNDEIIALYQMYVKNYQREYDIQANKFGKNRLTLKDDQIALNSASMRLNQTKSILNRLLLEREKTQKENKIKLEEIENKKISCNVIPAKILDEDDKFWYIIMPKYDKGDLSKFIGKLDSFEIINLGIELGKVYNCLIRNGLYYTDSKPSQVLYKCVSGNTFSIALGDLGSISKKDILILLSYSGETIGLKNIIQYAKRNKITIY